MRGKLISEVPKQWLAGLFLGVDRFVDEAEAEEEAGAAGIHDEIVGGVEAWPDGVGAKHNIEKEFDNFVTDPKGADNRKNQDGGVVRMLLPNILGQVFCKKCPDDIAH